MVGGLVGGLISAAQGGSFWAGAAQGALAGAIAGLAVDAALAVAATGGLAALAVGGIIAGAGGAIGSIAGDELASVINTGSLAPMDGAMKARAVSCGVLNICSFGFSSLLRAADEGLKTLGSNNSLPSTVKAVWNEISNFKFNASDVGSVFATTHYTIYGSMASLMFKSPTRSTSVIKTILVNKINKRNPRMMVQ